MQRPRRRSAMRRSARRVCVPHTTVPEVLAEAPVPMTMAQIRALAATPTDVPACTHPSPWTSMLLGVGVAIVTLGLGGVLVYLILRPRDGRQLGDAAPLPAPAAPSAPQVYLINTGGNAAQVVRAEPIDAPVRDDAGAALDRIEAQVTALMTRASAPASPATPSTYETPSTMRSYRLPWLADPQGPAIRIATAGDAPYAVTIRVVSPPGALAALSYAPNELNIAQPVIAPNMSAVPTGDTLLIPAGQKQTLLLNPRQALYARGNFANANPNGPVVLSVTAGDYRAANA